MNLQRVRLLAAASVRVIPHKSCGGNESNISTDVLSLPSQKKILGRKPGAIAFSAAVFCSRDLAKKNPPCVLHNRTHLSLIHHRVETTSLIIDLSAQHVRDFAVVATVASDENWKYRLTK